MEIENGTRDGSGTQRLGIEEAVRHYFEGWFGGDARRMERALHPQLAKRSLSDRARPQGETPEAAESLDSITAGEMIEATARGVGKTRALEAGNDPHIEIDVEDVYGKIANVTVRSAIYREYLHLVRTGDGWKIANALWQWT